MYQYCLKSYLVEQSEMNRIKIVIGQADHYGLAKYMQNNDKISKSIVAIGETIEKNKTKHEAYFRWGSMVCQ